MRGNTLIEATGLTVPRAAAVLSSVPRLMTVNSYVTPFAFPPEQQAQSSAAAAKTGRTPVKRLNPLFFIADTSF
jgi:hypothetical protein